MKTDENKKTDENQWKPMKIDEKTVANSLAANNPAANSLSIMTAFELTWGSTRRYHCIFRVLNGISA